MTVVPTDPQDELFDTLHDDGTPTGIAKPRHLVHRDGDWHRGLHIWVGFIDDAGVPHVIFQRRSLTKDTWPGALDVAVGGHVRSGESLEDTLREAEEEIGLRVTLAELVPIGQRWVRGGQPPIQDNELNEVFAVRCDLPLSAYRLHPEEVDALIAVPVADVMRLFRREIAEIMGREHGREMTRDERATLRRADFATRDDDYPLQSLRALCEVLAGEIPDPFEIRPRPIEPP